jgi:hypothetical protein
VQVRSPLVVACGKSQLQGLTRGTVIMGDHIQITGNFILQLTIEVCTLIGILISIYNGIRNMHKTDEVHVIVNSRYDSMQVKVELLEKELQDSKKLLEHVLSNEQARIDAANTLALLHSSPATVSAGPNSTVTTTVTTSPAVPPG